MGLKNWWGNRSYWQKGGMVILIIFFMVMSVFLLVPQLTHPKYIFNNGIWRTFPDSCVDSCPTQEQLKDNGRSCYPAFTEGWDCGKDKCWNGEKCVENSQKTRCSNREWVYNLNNCPTPIYNKTQCIQTSGIFENNSCIRPKDSVGWTDGFGCDYIS